MKLSLTFSDILKLIREELSESYPAFEATLACDNQLVSCLLKQHLPTPEQYAIALHNAVEKTNLPSSLKMLVDWYKTSASHFIIPSKSKPALELNKPKINSVSVKTQENNLSKTKTKKLKKKLSTIASTHRYSSCKDTECTVCEQIISKVPLTPCAHPGSKCYEGFFPHISRKLVSLIHKTKEYTPILTMSGIRNPLSAPAPKETVLISTAPGLDKTPAANKPMDTTPMVTTSPSLTKVGVKRSRKDTVQELLVEVRSRSSPSGARVLANTLADLLDVDAGERSLFLSYAEAAKKQK